MTTLTFQQSASLWSGRIWRGLKTFVGDIARGFVNISHHSFALLGLLAVLVCLLALARPEIRTQTIQSIQGWLFTRLHITEAEDERQQVLLRSLAAPSTDLNADQLALVQAIKNKYRVAPEPLNALILEVEDLANRSNLDPTLILAVMAVESAFNPFAQSPVGAQGLMQVMTKVHEDKYVGFGGSLAAFDPVANVRVGVNVLKECINRAGSLEGGLKLYVGAGNMKDDQGYAGKVMAENARLQQVAKGVKVPITPPPSTAAEAATARLESLWEKAQRLTPFGKDPKDDEEPR